MKTTAACLLAMLLLSSSGCGFNTSEQKKKKDWALESDGFKRAVLQALDQEVILVEPAAMAISDSPAIPGNGSADLIEAASICSLGGFALVKVSPHSQEIITPAETSSLVPTERQWLTNENYLKCVAAESSVDFSATQHEHATGFIRDTNGTPLNLDKTQ